MSVSIYELKTQLSKYIALIEQGIEEEIEVTKNGKIVAILASKKEKKPIFNAGKKQLGNLNYVVKDSIYDDINSSFYGD